MSICAGSIYSTQCLAEEAKKNDILSSLPPNTWTRVMDRPPTRAGILSYSGGVYDPEHHKYLLFGGGHNNYRGNEVYALDLSTLKWEKMYEPDSPKRYTLDNIDVTQGKLRDSNLPFTRHTYQMVTYVPELHGMFVWSGAGPGWKGIGTSKIPPDAWLYRYAENKWTLLSSNGPKTMGGGTCYDSEKKIIWAIHGTGRRIPAIHQFDIKTNTWSSRNISGLKRTWHNALLCMERYNRVLVIGGSAGRAWILNKDTFETTEISGNYTPDSRGGITYYEDQGIAIHMGRGEWAWLDYAGKKWNKLSVEGFPRVSPHGVWSRLFYNPIDKVLVVILKSGVYAYNLQLHETADTKSQDLK